MPEAVRFAQGSTLEGNCLRLKFYLKIYNIYSIKQHEQNNAGRSTLNVHRAAFYWRCMRRYCTHCYPQFRDVKGLCASYDVWNSRHSEGDATARISYRIELWMHPAIHIENVRGRPGIDCPINSTMLRSLTQQLFDLQFLLPAPLNKQDKNFSVRIRVLDKTWHYLSPSGPCHALQTTVGEIRSLLMLFANCLGVVALPKPFYMPPAIERWYADVMYTCVKRKVIMTRRHGELFRRWKLSFSFKETAFWCLFWAACPCAPNNSFMATNWRKIAVHCNSARLSLHHY